MCPLLPLVTVLPLSAPDWLILSTTSIPVWSIYKFEFIVNIIRRLYSTINRLIGKITIYRITDLRYSLCLKSNKCHFKAFVINIYHFPEHAILQFFARDIDTVNFIAIDKYHLCIHSFWKFWNKINNIFWVLKKMKSPKSLLYWYCSNSVYELHLD